MAYIIHEPRFLCQAKTQPLRRVMPPRRRYSLWLAFQSTEIIDNPFEPFDGDLLIETCTGQSCLHDLCWIARGYDLVRVKNRFTDRRFILPPPDIPQTWTDKGLWAIKFMTGDTSCKLDKFLPAFTRPGTPSLCWSYMAISRGFWRK